MHISGLTSSQVWASSARSLTNFGSGALTASSTVFTVLAAASSVDLRPSAGIVGHFTVSLQTGTSPTAACFVDTYDGVNAIGGIATVVGTNQPVTFTHMGTNSVGARARNADAAVAAHYMVAAFVLTI